MTARTFSLTMPITRLHNSNHRSHWAVIASKRAEMKTRAYIACRGMTPIPGKATLTVTFAFPDRHIRDLDNWEIKSAIDGAVKAGILTDDRHQVLTSITRTTGAGRSPKDFAVLTFTFSEVEE